MSKSEFLGKESIGKLLFKMSYPAIVAMATIALYNLVDAIFIGQKIGPDGITAATLIFPFQMILFSFSLMIGMGSASIISRRLGAKRHEAAERVFGNALTLGLILGIISVIFTWIFIKPLIYLLGGRDAVFTLSYDYLSVLIYGFIFMGVAIVLNHASRAEGNAKIAMISMVIAAILNATMDYVLMFIFDFGIKGAAYATLSANIFSFIFLTIYFYSGKSVLKIPFNYLILRWHLVKEILSIGLPSFARQASFSIVNLVLNNVLLIYGGSIAIAAFGIVIRTHSFFFMPVIGVVQGFMPIAGFNYGAEKYDRVKKTYWLAIKVVTVICSIAFILLLLFAKNIFGLFTQDPELLELAIMANYYIVALIVLAGFQVLSSGLYQALGKAKPAFVLALLRQVILLIPMIIVLPLFFGLQGIFIAFPIADLIAFIIIAFMIRKSLKNI